MRKLLCWLIVILIAATNWDVLEREFNLITQVPITFTISLLLCLITGIGFIWWLSRTLYGGRIETLETDKKSLEGRLDARDEELVKQKNECDEKIKTLESRLKIKDEELEKQRKEYEKATKTLQTSKTDKLTDNQIKVLEFIDTFEKNNPQQENQFPPQCSVEEVAKKFQPEYGEVNEIFRKLKRMGFVYSLWDGLATFHDMSRPINEEKPVRLTTEGREYLKSHRNASED